MIKSKVLFFLVFLAPSIVFSQVSITATGSSNTFNVTYPANITSVPAGMMVTFFSNQTITGSSFLNLNGLGAFPILKNVNQTLSSGNILAGQPVTVIFDGVNWQLLSVAAGTSSGSQWTSTTGGTIFYNGGNVGIGTDVANANFTLAPTYNLGWRYSAGNTSVAHSIGRASQGATPLQFNTTFNPGPTNPVFEFNSGAGNIITMLFNKNVGIGTGLPQNTLHVVGGVRIENLSTSGAVFSNLSGDLYVNTASGSVGVGTPNQIAYFGTSNSVIGSSFMTWNQTLVGFNVGDSNDNNGSGPNVGLYTLGYNSTAAGSYSYAIGTRNLASGNRSFALGNYANAIHLGSFVIGDWSGSSPSYTVSSGSDEFTARFSGGYRFYTKSDLSDGIFINQNGLGIGVTNPQNNLHVVGGARIVNLSTSGAVFANSSGDLYINTTTSANYWTVSGVNLQPQSSSHHINISSTTGTYRIGGIEMIRMVENTVSGQSLYFGGGGNVSNTGYANLAMGRVAGSSLTNGYSNIFIGNTAGQNNTSGNRNVFIGDRTGESNFGGAQNSFYGALAGISNNTGNNNTFLGYSAGYLNSSGSNNTFIGASIAFNNNGNSNTFIGFNAGGQNKTGSNNVFLGDLTGSLSSGSGNNFLGSRAGFSNGTGSNNIAIGYMSDFLLPNLTNAIAIGYLASVGGNNMMALGGVGSNAVSVGIGTTSPQNTLHVIGGARISNLSLPGAVFSTASGDLYINTATGALINFQDNLYTSAPNNTTYAAQLQVIGTTTDMDFVISPKGGGSILASAPDGTATGGNKRGGFGAIDLQRYRTQATQVASGTIAVLIGGNYNTASGSMSFVGNGNSNIAAGAYATIVNGQQNLISAGNNWNGILNGSNNTISGTASNAFIGAGNGNLVSGNFGVINGGSSNIASGSYSGITSGIGNIARSFGEVVVGTYNVDYTPFSAASFQSGDRIFTVGNGATSGTRSNAFTILKNGNVALGNINPAYQYDQGITAIVGQESLAHYTVSDSPGELFIDNYSATTGEFVPEIFGSQIGVGSALVLGGETNNDSNVNDPEVVVVNGKFSDGSALGFKPLFAVKNAGSNRFQVAASGVVTIASLTSAGTYLVQSNAQGKLSLATSSSFSLWTIAGTNIFPQNDQNNLGIGLGSISSPGLVAGASRYLTLAANQTNTNGYPSVELLSVNTALNQPVSKLEFINVVTPFATKSNHARIQAYTGRGTVANGQLGFFTSNGTLNEVMRINENGGVSIGSTYTPITPPISGLMVQGNVGIGTTVPGAKFHVKSNTSASPNLAMLIQNAGGSNILSFSDNGLLGLGTNLASRAYIEQFGSVGSTAAMFGLSGSGGVSLISSYPGIAFNGYYASSWTSIGSGYGADIDVNPTDGLMSFNTFSNAASANSIVTATPRMAIMNAGNVGIATITPNSTLQVNGSFAGKIVTGSGGFTYGAQDFAYIDGSNIGTTASLVLPNPTTCSGRIILWKRTYVGAGCTHNFTASGGANVEGAATYTTGSISIRKSVAFISDGTNWWVLYSF